MNRFIQGGLLLIVLLMLMSAVIAQTNNTISGDLSRTYHYDLLERLTSYEEAYFPRINSRNFSTPWEHNSTNIIKNHFNRTPGNSFSQFNTSPRNSTLPDQENHWSCQQILLTVLASVACAYLGYEITSTAYAWYSGNHDYITPVASLLLQEKLLPENFAPLPFVLHSYNPLPADEIVRAIGVTEPSNIIQLKDFYSSDTFIESFRSIVPGIPDYLQKAFEDESTMLLAPHNNIPSTQYYYGLADAVETYLNDLEIELLDIELLTFVAGAFPELYRNVNDLLQNGPMSHQVRRGIPGLRHEPRIR